MTAQYRAPVLLGREHNVEQFECRSLEQTEWLHKHARLSAATGTTRTLVVGEGTSEQVVAYYAWCMASVEIAQVPTRMRKGSGRYPQPVALLARLGVDVHHEGRGIGAALMRDVIARSAAISEKIGCRGLLVHAESDAARDFYCHLIPEFEASPTDDLHLFLLMKDIRLTLGYN